MYTISKTFKWDAAHQLHGLPDGHQCGRLHGHTYRCAVELTAPTLDQYGFVVDYGELKPFKQWIDATLDHRFLNDIPHFANNHRNTTAENLAVYLHAVVSELPVLRDNADRVRVAVGVSETEATWAWWRP